MHIKAFAPINDAESGPHQDYDKWLERPALYEPVGQYGHNDEGVHNICAPTKHQIINLDVVGAVTDGNLDFGPWEQIFYGEFDECRRKRVLAKIVGV